MPLRFDVLVQLESVLRAPRQPVNPEATDYLGWLLDEAAVVRPTFLKRVEAAVSDFNRATKATDVGLDLPFDLWRNKARSSKFSVGDIVEVVERRRSKLAHSFSAFPNSHGRGTYAVVINVNGDEYHLSVSGEASPRWINRRFFKPCRSAGALIPGPLKLRARAEHKVITDYSEEPEPAAASLLDLVRATVVFDEPYALACFVKYVQKTMRVVRLKNRFEHDVAERISAARLLQEFYAAEAWGYDDADSVASGDSGRESYDKMYRDVMLNVEVPREGGPPFIAELQVALSGISILKKSEQVVYTVMRMKQPAELVGTFVFDREDVAVDINITETESAAERLARERGLKKEEVMGLEETIATKSSNVAAGPFTNPDVATLSRDYLLQAERIEQLEAALSSTRAANETTVAALKGEVEHLQAALNDRPSWLGCAPTCDRAS